MLERFAPESIAKAALKDGIDLTPTLFYQRLRSEKALPTTSQVSPAEYTEAFHQALTTGDEVVYIGLSSGLSGSMQSATLAAGSGWSTAWASRWGWVSWFCGPRSWLRRA